MKYIFFDTETTGVPKLQELHRKLFGCDFDNAHDALSDIRATEKCFWEMRKRKLI